MKTTLPPRAEQNIETQLRVVARLSHQDLRKVAKPVPFVTISRQFGCEAVALAERLASKLDKTENLEHGSWQVYNRRLIESMTDQKYSYDQLMSVLDAKARGGIEEFMETLVGKISDLKLVHKLVATLRATATVGRCIIIGRGGAIVTRGFPGGIHIRLVADEESRLMSLKTRFNWSESNARAELKRHDEDRTTFILKNLHRDPHDSTLYDLILNSGRLTQDEMVALIHTLFCSRMS